MKIKDIIEKEIPKKMKAGPDKVKQVAAVIELQISGDDGGVWTIDCTKAGGKISAGSTGKAHLIVKIADCDFVDMFNEKLKPASAYFSGKLKVEGDLSIALKLGNVL